MARYTIDHRAFDQLTMTGPAIVDGKEVRVRGTWAFGPPISMYDETNQCWLTPTEWEWVNF